MKYHVNSNGEAGLCSATKGKCPFGSEADHFTAPDAARSAFEKTQNSVLAGSKKNQAFVVDSVTEKLVALTIARGAPAKASYDYSGATLTNEDGISFQNIEATRTLAVGIPQHLADHVNQNTKELEHLTHEERIALGGYTGFAAGVCNNILLGEKYEYYDKAPLWRESKGPCDFVSREDLVDYMQTLDDILAPRLEEPRILYRGIPIYSSLHDEIGASIGKDLKITDTKGLVEGLKEYYKVGKTFNYDTYLSTSHSANYTANRTSNEVDTKGENEYTPAEIRGIQFELKTNAGLDVTSAARSHHAHEREVVLPRDTHFKVTNVYIKPEVYKTVGGFDDLSSAAILSKDDYRNIAVVVQMTEVDDKGNEITHTNDRLPRKPIEDIIPAQLK